MTAGSSDGKLVKLQHALFWLRMGFALLVCGIVTHLAARALWAVSGPYLKYVEGLKHEDPHFLDLPESTSAILLLHLMAPQILFVLYGIGKMVLNPLLKKRVKHSAS